MIDNYDFQQYDRITRELGAINIGASIKSSIASAASSVGQNYAANSAQLALSTAQQKVKRKKAIDAEINEREKKYRMTYQFKKARENENAIKRLRAERAEIDKWLLQKVTEYQNEPFYHEFMKIVLPVLGATHQANYQRSIEQDTAKAMQEDMDKPLMASMGMENINWTLVGAGIVAIMLLKILSKKKGKGSDGRSSAKVETSHSAPPQRRQSVEYMY